MACRRFGLGGQGERVNDTGPTASRWQRIDVLVWILLILDGLLLAWGLNKGFDIKDEAFALLNYRWPGESHHFGSFFEHVADRMLLGQPLTLQGYRAVGVIVRLLGVWVLCRGLRDWLLALLPESHTRDRWFLRRPYLLGLLVLADWFAFTRYQMTLTYYTMNQACLYAGAGGLLAFLADPARKRAHGWLVLAGLATGLNLFIKFPSSIAFAAMAAGLLGIFSLPALRGFSLWKALGGFLAGYALAMGAFFAAAMPPQTWWREFTDQVGATAERKAYGLKPMLSKYIRSYVKVLKVMALWYGAPLALTAAALLTWRHRRPVPHKARLIWLGLALVLAGGVAWWQGFFWRPMVFLWLVTVLLALVHLLPAANETRAPGRIWAQAGLLVLFLGLVNFVGILGSASSISTSFTAYLAPPVAGVLLLIVLLPDRKLQGLFAAALLIALQGAWVSMFVFEGQRYMESRISQTRRVEGVPALVGIELDPPRAEFFEALHREVQAHRSRPDKPLAVAGLTDMPGMVYALDAYPPEAPYFPWISADKKDPAAYCALLEQFQRDMAAQPEREWVVLVHDKIPPAAWPCTSAFLEGFTPKATLINPAQRNNQVTLHVQERASDPGNPAPPSGL